MIRGLGPIFRIHRKNSRILSEEVCTKTGISTRKLSEFENGKKDLTEKEMRSIYRCLHIIYYRDEKDLLLFREKFYQFYEAVLSYGGFADEFSKLRKLEESIQTTEIYPQYLLAKMINKVYTKYSYDESGIIGYIDKIKSLFPYLDENQKQIFYDTAGVYCKRNLDYEMASSYFDKAAVYGYEPATAMMLYHKTDILMDTGRLIEAMECVKKAKAIFDSLMFVKRSLLCNGTIGIIYTRLGLYDKAIPLYMKSIDILSHFDMINDQLALCNNLSWLYILSKQYDKVINSANELLAVKRNHVPSFFYKAYAYDKLNEKFKSKESIKRAKSLASNASCTPYMAAIVDAFYTLLSEQKGISTKIKKLNFALQQAEKCNDYQLELFVLNMIVETYQEYGDYQEAFAYQSKMIQIYEKRK